MTDAVADLLAALAGGTVEVVDLSQPLSESTPVIQLPPPFVNTPGLTVHEISRFDERGPAWAWNWLEIGEHVGTHFDAPSHWVTGRDGADLASVPAAHLVGPAVVVDRVAETEADPDYLLTVDDLRAWESEHGALPEGGWLLLRTGWDARAHDADAFLNAGSGQPRTPGFDAACARLSPRRRGCAAWGWRPSASTPARRAASTRRSPCTTTCSARASTGSRSSPTSGGCRPTGALLVVAPLKLVGGTGSPVRVLALVPRGGLTPFRALRPG